MRPTRVDLGRKQTVRRKLEDLRQHGMQRNGRKRFISHRVEEKLRVHIS